MTKMSDLPGDLVEEILARVPLTSLSAVRSTCKKWDASSKNRIFGKKEAAAKKQFLGFMMKDYRVCSLRFDLHGIRNDADFVDPSIKQIGILNQVEISQVFHCDGLLLCVTKDNSSLVVWNPYLGQTRWIQPRNNFHIFDMYALGYDSNNRNHKILRMFDEYGCRNYGFEFEIYDFSSNSWRVLDVTPDWYTPFIKRCVSLNGNTYFWAKERRIIVDEEDEEEDIGEPEDFLVRFDFTTERFGPHLCLPIPSHEDNIVTLSSVKEEQLALLYECWEISQIIEIWVTTKIEPNVLSWSKFLQVDMKLLNSFRFEYGAGSFFIDQETKVVVVFDLDGHKRTKMCRYQTAYIIGEDGYFKSVNIGEAPNLGKHIKKRNVYRYCVPLVCSSYVPSLVQLQINQPGKRKVRDY